MWGGVLVVLALLAAPGARGQEVRKSQRGTVSQTVAGTEITLDYNRPVARGRTLFGTLVPRGKVWNPGANEATTITFSDDVVVQGAPLAAGRYSLWVIPEADRWTVLFSTEADVWHNAYPEGRDALRVTATPREGSHMEVLAFYFPEVGPDATTLVLHWGTTVVPLEIRLKA